MREEETNIAKKGSKFKSDFKTSQDKKYSTAYIGFQL